jgi:diguanylate cyclase (GGDEF)-like protein
MNSDEQDRSLSIDQLTGLSNRLGIECYLKQLPIEDIETGVYVLSIELSRFGKLNDSVGGDLGDKVISTVAKRLQKIFANASLIARTHGNHFGIVFGRNFNINEQIELLSDFAQRPIALRGEVIVMSVRIGVAELGPQVESPSGLLHAAEVALHHAKREKLKCSFFSDDLEREARKAHRLENDLRVSLVSNHAELHKAISNKEFRLSYQPIVDLATNSVHAMEALIRWYHPVRGPISPSEFIPIAEQIQVMDVLGSWILRRACADALKFPNNVNGSKPGVSVNISATQFVEHRILVEAVKQALKETGMDPALLKLEITESAAFTSDKVNVIETIRGLGCKIALDDFGTGYSSLTQLNELPLDYIKLDKSFVSALGGEDFSKDQSSDRITRAVLAIAQALKLTPIVEGVETDVQCERVRGYGANLVQGYLFSKPLELEDACNFVIRFNQSSNREGGKSV